jgi:cobalt-precorrin 5A hydrolase/cobalt-precorrin 5A hydrolase/precorrin-3B C17-methyltransferase
VTTCRGDGDRGVAPARPRGGRRAAVARLVVGAGCSRGCPPAELAALVEHALADVGGEVVAVATVDRRRDEPCVVALAAGRGVPLHVHPAASLAPVDVPTPSAVVARHVGTASVAEAAALLSAGPGARLRVVKRRSPHATCAVAEEAGWRA